MFDKLNEWTNPAEDEEAKLIKNFPQCDEMRIIVTDNYF